MNRQISTPALASIAALALMTASPALAQTPGCNALQLTRSPSYARVLHNTALVPSVITVEAWIQVASNFPLRGTIARKNPGAGRESWLLRLENRRVNFSIRARSGLVAAFSTVRIATDVPTHVAATYDGTAIRLYINGRLVTTRTARVGAIVNTGGDLRIGQGDGTSTEQFLGRLDEVRIWRVARSASQIAAGYRSILNRVSGEVASYSFDRNFRDSTGSFNGSFVGSGASFRASMFNFGRFTQHPKGSRRGTEYAGHVSSLGDLNGDGFDDYGVGHGNATGNLATQGALTAYSGFDHRILWAFQGATAAARFGWHSDGGDLNGDGFSDAIIGEPGRSSNRGLIWIVDGRTRRIRFFAQGIGRRQFGDRVLAVPYLDTDGLCDVVTTDGDQLIALRANGRQAWRVTPSTGVRVRSMDVVGDINNDGCDDIVIGMPEYRSNTSLTNEGLVQVRSGSNGALLDTVRGGRAGMRAGAAVAGIHSDIDGDKVPDFALTTPNYLSNRGGVFFVSGRRRAILGNLLGTTGQQLGIAMCSAEGDLNGDGVFELRVSGRNGNQGRVFVVNPRLRRLEGFLQGASTSPNFGSSIAGLETNGRPLVDVVVAEKDVAARVWDGCPADRAPSHRSYGQTCAGTAGRRPRLAVVDKAGIRVAGRYTMRVASARAGSAVALQLGVGRANINLDAIGMTGCRYLLGNAILTSARAVDANGFADVTYAVPNNPSLTGARVTFQALCLDAGGNRFNLTASNGSEIVHGSRF